MEFDVILIAKIIAIGVIHWIFVPIALRALVERQRVLGGKKAPWAIAIIFLTCIGSLVYLIIHPNLQPEAEAQTERW